MEGIVKRSKASVSKNRKGSIFISRDESSGRSNFDKISEL